MISVGLIFIVFAGIAFLGFVIDTLFDKIKITSILPLMLIGLIAGPVLHLVASSSSGTLGQLTPYITAIAVSFILFDVGLNMRIEDLRNVLVRATKFTFLTQASTGIVLAVAAHYLIGWTILESFIFGFAVSGPSSIIVPTLAKMVKIPKDLKTTLLYESVFTDTLQLIIPLILIDLLSGPGFVLSYIGSFVFTVIFGSILLGFISSLFWLYLLNRFNEYSKNYSWMLTITMIIATYGLSQQLGLSSAITIFFFGLLFSNIGSFKKPAGTQIKKRLAFMDMFSLPTDIAHVKEYQREVVFFTSTFFFVYIGLLFNISGLDYMVALLALLFSVLVMIVRAGFTPILKPFMAKNPASQHVEHSVVRFDMARGLSSAIIATVPLTMGVNIPGFLDVIFLVILFTNVISSLGIFATYSPNPKEKAEKEKTEGEKSEKAGDAKQQPKPEQKQDQKPSSKPQQSAAKPAQKTAGNEAKPTSK